MNDQRRVMDGELFVKTVLGGAANLHANLQIVNDLNVFPIPDGDTGENMYLTVQGGLDAMHAEKSQTLCDKAEALSKGMLLGARGNSGVILSQLFHGIAEGLAGKETCDVQTLGAAFEQGVKRAYGAVARPVEGTVLTVAREATKAAKAKNFSSVEDFFACYLEEAKASLERTPELLAVLKEAGVIDSGGAGLVYIAEGFCKALAGEELDGELATADASKKSLDFSLFDENTEMVFGYCTELLLQLQRAKTDVDAFSVDELIAFLETVGDSIVAFKTGSVVKIHVHTLEPWKVLAHCQTFGEFLTVKIENMTLQHNETTSEKEKEKEQAAEKDVPFKMPKRARRKFATVTVATGEGLKDTFKEMGADYVISGGQTNNPSAEDFIAAFEAVNADHVFVLPNNGNVILAAKQAAEIYKDSDIRVVESKSIGQGYSALSMLDYESDDADAIAASMQENMANTTTGLVARAVRDAYLDGVDVKKGWYMGFTDKTMRVCQEDKASAACALADEMLLRSGEPKEYVIVVYGKGATDEEKARLSKHLQSPLLEVYEIDGGQDVYDFLFITE